ncbi:MAG: hypothetical protein WEA81_00485, partial [Dehalococcoidia bacterium]
VADGSPVHIVEGDGGATTLIEVSEAAFSDFLHELLTANGAVRTGRARITRGSLEEWQRWEPAMQALCFGRPIYTSNVWETLVDRDGTRLDLSRSFAVDDPDDEMREFLATTGYLHIRAVFSPEEVALFGGRGRTLSRPHDAGRSVLVVVGQCLGRGGGHAHQLSRSFLSPTARVGP